MWYRLVCLLKGGHKPCLAVRQDRIVTVKICRRCGEDYS